MLYVDEYGVFWKRINELEVFSNELGWGGWFNGQGLTSVKDIEASYE